jgi:5-methylcytosine-specific restriction protein A
MPMRPPVHGAKERAAQRKQTARTYDRYRGSAASRGYDGRWQRYRATYLQQHPLCAHCDARGETVPATVVDHKQPHKGNAELFWNAENHQPLCERCHNVKTATKDGGFGR